MKLTLTYKDSLIDFYIKNVWYGNMSFSKNFNLLKHLCSITQSILQTNPDNQNTKGLDCQINEYLIGQVLLVSLIQVSP